MNQNLLCHVHRWLWNRNGQYSFQATLTNKVNGAATNPNLISLNLSTQKNVWSKKNNHFSSTPNDWDRNGQYSGQATVTNKVNGASD